MLFENNLPHVHQNPSRLVSYIGRLDDGQFTSSPKHGIFLKNDHKASCQVYQHGKWVQSPRYERLHEE